MTLIADASLSRRYAEAVIGALEKTGRVEAGLQEIKAVAKVYSESVDLQRFLGSPEIAEEDKRRLIVKLWSDSVGPETLGLLHLLLKRDRFDHLPQIAEEAVRVSEARQGLLRGTVTTAHPISSTEAQALADAVGSLLEKRVLLERQIDPRVIGGARIAVGTLLIDGSVQNFLRKIKDQLTEAKVA